MAGIGAGFASVFGTPLAGAVFALEVLALGRLPLTFYRALLPCLAAALLADQVNCCGAACWTCTIRITPRR